MLPHPIGDSKLETRPAMMPNMALNSDAQTAARRLVIVRPLKNPRANGGSFKRDMPAIQLNRASTIN